MIQNETKYANTTRTISGIANIVFDNDVVLLCDTSLGVVELILLGIPQGNFSTQYKLYVVDVSNNATTNNITIQAPLGVTINNSTTAIINVNNGVAVVSISSNNTYNANLNYGNSGGFISLSYNTLISLINSNGLIPSQQYLITNAIFTNTLPAEQVPIVVTAITTNNISLSGSGIFLNADYQNAGDYSSVVGFIAQLGVYDTAGIYVIGMVVIWNNLHFLNISGNNTGDPDVTSIDWTPLPKTSTNGYITEIDIIKYIVASNQISYRTDLRNNVIENNLQDYVNFPFIETFYVFQWGNNGVAQNVISGESYFDIQNQTGTILNNIVNLNSKVNRTTYNDGTIINNIFTQKTTITVRNNFGRFDENIFENVEDIDITNIGRSSVIFQNTIKFGTSSLIRNLVDNCIIQRNVVVANLQAFTNFNLINSQGGLGVIEDNIFQNFDILRINDNKGTIKFNIVESFSRFEISENNGDISTNTVSFRSIFRIEAINQGQITGNNITFGSNLNISDNSNVIQNNELSENSTIFSGGINFNEISNNLLKNNSLLNITGNNSGTIKYNNLTQFSKIRVIENIDTISYNNLLQDSLITFENIFLATFNRGKVRNNNLVNSKLEFSFGLGITAEVDGNNLTQNSAIVCQAELFGKINLNTLRFSSNINIFNVNPLSTFGIHKNVMSSTNITANQCNADIFNNNFQEVLILVSNNNIESDVNFNDWHNVQINVTTMPSGIINTTISGATYSCQSFNQNVVGGIVQNGIGTTKYILDMNDINIYDPILEILIIPTCLNTFFGYFNLTNCSGKVIGEIQNASNRFPTRFMNSDVNSTMNFQVKNPLSLATPDELVFDLVGVYPINLQLDFLFSVNDFIDIFKLASNINIIQEYKHYI